MTNHFNYEKTVIFGGITYSKIIDEDQPANNQKESTTRLSNSMYVIEVR